MTEGGKLELKCSAWGYPAPTIQWFKVSTDGQAEVELTSNKRVVLADSEDGLRNASLTITDISIEDYGTYKCVADNGRSYVLDTNSTVNSAAILVRVKGTHHHITLSLVLAFSLACVSFSPFTVKLESKTILKLTN